MLTKVHGLPDSPRSSRPALAKISICPPSSPYRSEDHSMPGHLRRALTFALLLFPWAIVQGEEEEAEKLAEGHSIHGEAFNEGPRQAGYLMPGQGDLEFPVTTAHPDAAAFISQGVGQLHVYFYFEAERSFRQAAAIDPDCPMAYWGMALANSNNQKRAEAFLKEALGKAKVTQITPREQLYLDALAERYKDKADAKTRRQGWLKGLEKVVQQFPEDLDARSWLAQATWENSRSDGIGSREAVSIVLDTVLDKAPLHPGAHHHKIHLWDNVDQNQALASAAKFAESAPGIAHAWHMPGHTYTGLKRFHDAAYQQEGSARVDHAYMIRDRVMPFLIHNYAHNNQWLSQSLTRAGQPRKAIAVARNLVEQPRDPKKNNEKSGGSPQRSGRNRWLEALVTFELWDDLLADTLAGHLDWSDLPHEQMQKAHSLGLAYAYKKDLDNLKAQIEALNELAQGNKREEDSKESESKAKDEKKPEASKAPRVPGLPNALAELEGYQKLLEDDSKAAIEQFKKARSMRPESLARILLAAGQVEDALKKAQEAVDRSRNEVAPLAVQVEVLQGAGKVEEARNAYEKLLPLIQEADQDVPVMERLASITQDWQTEGLTLPALEPKESSAIDRIDLETVGPLQWTPSPADSFSVLDTSGQHRTLNDFQGKNLLLVFHLGGDCAHCMQQLVIFSDEIEAIRATGTEVLAVSTDTYEAACALVENAEEVQFQMPMLADPALVLFKKYRCFDDFEGVPLHGTFLIDRSGMVRYQDISYEPFYEVEFLIKEANRVNRMTEGSPIQASE